MYSISTASTPSFNQIINRPQVTTSLSRSEAPGCKQHNIRGQVTHLADTSRQTADAGTDMLMMSPLLLALLV
jgi:hypothetical protein